jgi:hypothetical protein
MRHAAALLCLIAGAAAGPVRAAALPVDPASGADRTRIEGWRFEAAMAGASLQLLTPIGAAVPGVATRQGARLSFEPSTPLSPCTGYTLELRDAAQHLLQSRRLRTVCSDWSAPQQVDAAAHAREPDFSVASQQLAAFAGGDLLALWTQGDGGRDGIEVSRYLAATDVWSAPRRVDLAGGAGADLPALAVGPDGVALAAWSQGWGGRDALFASAAVADCAACAPQRLDAAALPASAVNVALAAGATVSCAAWQQRDSGSSRVFAAVRRGALWSAPRRLGGAPAYAPTLVATPQGCVAAWEQGRGGHARIWGAVWRDGNWRAARRLGDAAERGSQPLLRADADGGVLLAWVRGSGAARRIALRRLLPRRTRAWSPRAGSGAALAPALVADASGNLTLAWQQADAGGRDAILVSRFDAATRRWSAPQRLDAGGGAGSPVLGVDPAGNVGCAWYQDGPQGLQVQFARYDAGQAAWSAPRRLSDPRQTVHAEFPQIAVDAAGSITVVWDQFNGWRTVLMARRLP